MNRKRIKTTAAIVVLAWMIRGSAETSTNHFTLVTTEVSLGKIPLAARLDRGVRSPDSRQMAYPVVRGGQWTVSRNGVEGPQYDKVDDLAFSSNSLRFAYTGLRQRKWRVVVNGQESQDFDYVDQLLFDGPNTLRFLARRFDENFQDEFFSVQIELSKK